MKKIILYLSILLLLAGCGSKSGTINTNNNDDNGTIIEEPPIIVEPEEIYYSKFDGLEMENEDDDQNRVYAIMFDNQLGARPQAGLAEASIVYEIRVEGNATRYLGIFIRNDNVQIGPVRSARPYYVQTASEYDAIYTHFGGSDAGLNKIGQLGLYNINGIYSDGTTFTRMNHKIAPHNAYTSLDTLNSHADNAGYPYTNGATGFKFNETVQSIDGESVVSIYMNYSSNTTEYTFDESTKSYTRYKDGIVHIDENTGQPLVVSNIIIQLVPSYLHSNGVHKIIENVGQGNGYLLSNGESVPIHWSKSTESGPTLYTIQSTGEEITLNPGQTWIQWIDPTSPLELTPLQQGEN